MMNDLLFQREKHIKDELFLWFCLGFLINICYTKFDSPLNTCSYLNWWRTKLSLVLWKICVLYFSYIYIYAFSVKSAIIWNHSAFFVFEIKPDYIFVALATDGMRCAYPKPLLYASCKFLGNTWRFGKMQQFEIPLLYWNVHLLHISTVIWIWCTLNSL